VVEYIDAVSKVGGRAGRRAADWADGWARKIVQSLMVADDSARVSGFMLNVFDCSQCLLACPHQTILRPVVARCSGRLL
jgi:hypothetical protein